MRWRASSALVALLVGCGGRADPETTDAGRDAVGEAASDAPGDADAAPPSCPALLPARGAPCAALGKECAYATDCGGLVRAFCGGSAGVWELEVVRDCSR